MARPGESNEDIQGKGTQDEPLNAWGYVAVKVVLENLALEQINGLRSKVVTALTEAGYRNTKKLESPHLVEVLSSVLRLRADLKPNRYSYGSGTSFLMVKLKQKGMPRYKTFQKDLEGVAGVIEWDHIPGRNADYLIRVVGKLGDPQMHVISETISGMANVAEVYAPAELTIAKSGVVDNFQPEDFLKFDLEGHPTPPKLHPWRDKVVLDDDQLTLPYLSR